MLAGRPVELLHQQTTTGPAGTVVRYYVRADGARWWVDADALTDITWEDDLGH